MLVGGLLNLGLTQKEAEIYLATLQLGTASVQQIAEKAEVNRTTAYSHIKKLIARGLINTQNYLGKPCYVAEKPEKLKEFCQQQEQELARRRSTIENIMPELESLYNLATTRPTVRLYSLEELRLMRRYVLNLRSDELLNIFNYELFKEFIDKNYIKELLDSTLKFRGLYIAQNKVLDRRLHALRQEEKFCIKYLPSERFNFLCEILVGDREVFINRENDSLIIKDPIFSQTFKIVFNTLWEMAEEF